MTRPFSESPWGSPEAVFLGRKVREPKHPWLSGFVKGEHPHRLPPVTPLGLLWSLLAHRDNDLALVLTNVHGGRWGRADFRRNTGVQ